MLFTYSALKPTGEKYQDTREAADRFDLMRQLKEEGVTVVSVSETKSKGSGSLEKLLAGLSKVKTVEKVIFARNLAAMLSAGLSLTRALSVIERQATNKALKKVVGGLTAEINKGKTLHEAMAAYPAVFSKLFVSMVRAGENSGGLAESLRVVAVQMDNTYKLQKKVRGAMLYPGIIITVMVIIGALMLIYVVPTLTKTFTELAVELPASTQFVIGASEFLKNNILLSLGILIALGLGLFGLNRTARGKRTLHYAVMKVPIVGSLIKQTNTARTTRTLASLLSSGVAVGEALSITADVVQNVYFKDVIAEAAGSIEKGVTMSSIFAKHTNLYPIFVSEMMSVGEETGKTSGMLLEVALFYENEVDQRTKDLSTIIEPFLMVFIGLVVGFFAISMISPTYSLMDSI
jgi:type IV pilus assembly protein PilC